MAAFAPPRTTCTGSLASNRSARYQAQRIAPKQCLLVRCQTAQLQQAVTAEAPAAPTLKQVPGKVCCFDAPQFDQLTAAAGQRLVVVDVFTQWCGPCKMIAPELEKMAEEWGEGMIMSKIDCTSNPDNKKWAMAQNVKALPTFILFKEGKRVTDMTGAKAANLRKLIESHM